jgi:hypothetical protein
MWSRPSSVSEYKFLPETFFLTTYGVSSHKSFKRSRTPCIVSKSTFSCTCPANTALFSETNSSSRSLLSDTLGFRPGFAIVHNLRASLIVTLVPIALVPKLLVCCV